MRYIISSFVLVSTFMFSISTIAETHGELISLCHLRVKCLENELVNVLSPRKYRSNIKKFMAQNNIDAKNYNDEIRSLKTLLEKKNHEIDSIDCLLRTNHLLIMLDGVATAGGKSLNDFSKTWQIIFRGQAKWLRYTN